jgi:futalosine hydrolase
MILVVTAVDAERDAVVRDLGPGDAIDIAGLPGIRVECGAGVVHVVSGGIGPVAAAATTAVAVATHDYELVASAGIAGGFGDRATVGSIVVADRVTFADLGVLGDDGFLDLRAMGLPQDTSYRLLAEPITQRLTAGAVPVAQGQVLTLACMTGTDAAADELEHRFPLALAEAMEGYGVVEATLRAARTPTHVTEIRTISNLIGRRDRATWRMSEAFDALSSALATLFKEPLPALKEPLP